MALAADNSAVPAKAVNAISFKYLPIDSEVGRLAKLLFGESNPAFHVMKPPCRTHGAEALATPQTAGWTPAPWMAVAVLSPVADASGTSKSIPNDMESNQTGRRSASCDRF